MHNYFISSFSSRLSHHWLCHIFLLLTSLCSLVTGPYPPGGRQHAEGGHQKTFSRDKPKQITPVTPEEEHVNEGMKSAMFLEEKGRIWSNYYE